MKPLFFLNSSSLTYTSYFILSILFLTSCGGSSNDESTKEVKYPIQLNYNEDYPVKDIALADIADIEYISLKGEDAFLEGGASYRGLSISDKHIVLGNYNEGTVFIFDRTGNLVNKFNRKGNGPAEYLNILKVVADFKNNEIFVFDNYTKYKILVYSFEGEFKRRFEIPEPLWINVVIDYDDEYLLAHFEELSFSQEKTKTDNIFYYFISKNSGEFIPVNIIPNEVISEKTIVTSESKKDGEKVFMATMTSKGSMPITKNGSDVLISDFGCDTIYMSTGDKFNPFIVKSPPIINSEEPTLVYPLLRTTKYTFLQKRIRRAENDQQKDFVIDNQTGKIYEANITDEYIKLGGSFHNNLPQNYLAYTLSTLTFIELNEEGKLEGELKEFVSTLKEDDNDFLVLIKFKD